MNEKIKWSFGGAWLATAFSALLLPVFLPSFGGADPINIATAIMTTLSFPTGLFAVPIKDASQLVFGVDPNSIGGMYLNVRILFGLGLMQWFLLVPRLLRKIESGRAETKVLEGGLGTLNAGEAFARTDFGSRIRSPVDRVINDVEVS